MGGYTTGLPVDAAGLLAIGSDALIATRLVCKTSSHVSFHVPFHIPFHMP